MEKEFVYDQNAGIADNRSKNCLFMCYSITQIIALFASTFLIAHIYSFSGDIYSYIFNVCVYNLVVYGTMAVFYFIAAKIVDATNRISIYRISLVIETLLVVLFIFKGEEIAQYLILAGVIKGIGDAFYYASYNVLKQEMVSKNSIGNYVSGIYVATKIIDLVCPVILGALIDVSTYSTVAIVVCAICIIQIIISCFIKAKKPQGSKYSLKEFFGRLKQNPKAHKQVWFIYGMSFLFVNAVISRVLNICIMMEYHNALSLGIITSVLSVATILTIVLVKKFTKAGHRNWLFGLSAALLIISSIVFVINTCKWSVVVFDASLTIGSIIFKINYDAYRNGILKEAGLYQDIGEHHTVMETIYAISRLIGFSIVILIAVSKVLILFKIFLIVISCIYATLFILTGVYETKFIKPNQTNDISSKTK